MNSSEYRRESDDVPRQSRMRRSADPRSRWGSTTLARASEDPGTRRISGIRGFWRTARFRRSDVMQSERIRGGSGEQRRGCGRCCFRERMKSRVFLCDEGVSDVCLTVAETRVRTTGRLSRSCPSRASYFHNAGRFSRRLIHSCSPPPLPPSIDSSFLGENAEGRRALSRTSD